MRRTEDLDELTKRVMALENKQTNSLIVKYGAETENLYLPNVDTGLPAPFTRVVVFKDSFKLPLEMIGIMQKPMYDRYSLISRSMELLEYLRKTGQKAAIKEAYNAEKLMESEWADVFLVL